MVRSDLLKKRINYELKLKAEKNMIASVVRFAILLTFLIYCSKISDSADVEDKPESCASESCSCETKTSKDGWPVERGNYFVGNKKESIAINTLSNTELPKQLAGLLGDTIAIVGYCETENTGIEKVVKNIISNPNIRTLIVCGYESGQDMMGGHFSGQAMLSLYSNGMTEKKRIIGAKGKRPIVRNLNPEQVERFQSQVEIVELIGNNSMDDIIRNVKIVHNEKKAAFDKKIVNDFAGSEIIAQKPEKLRLDRKGYFVVLPNKAVKKRFSLNTMPIMVNYCILLPEMMLQVSTIQLLKKSLYQSLTIVLISAKN